jgi:aldose 1-epimerase
MRSRPVKLKLAAMERIEFGNSALRVEAIPELGGRLARLQLRADGVWHDALVPIGTDPTLPPRWPKGGAYPLVPYSNRIENARLRHDGNDFDLAPHPDAIPHTLHGLAHLRSWRVQARGADTLALCYTHAPDAHWPWAFEATQKFWVGDARLGIAIAITNTDKRSAPAGIGWHPYFPIKGDPNITLSAATEWLQNDANVATGDVVPGPSRGLTLDAQGGTRYLGGWQGGASFDTGTGLRLDLRADAPIEHMVVHRPPNIDYLCLEPVSHVANGFNLAAAGQRETGTKHLMPGESMTGQFLLALAYIRA